MAPTTTALTSSAGTSTYGESVTLTATVSTSDSYAGTPTGTVMFAVGGTELGSETLVDGVATLTTSSLPTGTPDVTADYMSGSDFDTSDGSLTQTVDTAALTIAANNTSIGYGTSSLSDGYTVTGLVGTDSVSSVEYTTNDSTSGAGYYKAGSWTITPSDAFGSGLSNYTITYDSGTLTITPDALTISSFAAANKTYNANTSATITNDGAIFGGVYLGELGQPERIECDRDLRQRHGGERQDRDGFRVRAIRVRCRRLFSDTADHDRQHHRGVADNHGVQRDVDIRQQRRGFHGQRAVGFGFGVVGDDVIERDNKRLGKLERRYLDGHAEQRQRFWTVQLHDHL